MGLGRRHGEMYQNESFGKWASEILSFCLLRLETSKNSENAKKNILFTYFVDSSHCAAAPAALPQWNDQISNIETENMLETLIFSRVSAGL